MGVLGYSYNDIFLFPGLIFSPISLVLGTGVLSGFFP
jgi:hypothetical protein